MRRWIGLVLALSSCTSVAALETSALRHEERARDASLRGDGKTAARETNLAASDREAARLRHEKRGRYWASEIQMQ